MLRAISTLSYYSVHFVLTILTSVLEFSRYFQRLVNLHSLTVLRYMLSMKKPSKELKTQLDLSRPLGPVPKCLPSFDAQSRMQNSIAYHWFSYKVYFGCAHLRSDTGIASVVSIIFQKHLRPRFIFLSPEFCNEVILILFVDVVEVKIKYRCRFQNRISCR